MGLYQVVAKQRFHQQEVRNVFYYESTPGEPTNVEWGDVANEIKTVWQTHLVNFLSNQWSYYAIDVRRVDLAGLPTAEYAPSTGTLVGGLTSDTTATQVALLARCTGTTTKPNRTRSYLCGFTEGFLTNSLWISSVQQAARDWATDMVTLNIAGTNQLDRQAAEWNLQGTVVVAWNPVLNVFSSEVPATQRRRRIGRGI